MAQRLNYTLLLSDQPTTCPLCSWRTEFTENPDGSQEHTCPNPACGVTFRAEEDDDEHEDA